MCNSGRKNGAVEFSGSIGGRATGAGNEHGSVSGAAEEHGEICVPSDECDGKLSSNRGEARNCKRKTNLGGPVQVAVPQRKQKREIGYGGVLRVPVWV